MPVAFTKVMCPVGIRPEKSTAPQPIFPRLSLYLTNHVKLAGEPKARSEMLYPSHKMPEQFCVRGIQKRVFRHL